MGIDGGTTNRRLTHAAPLIAGGWAAITLLFAMTVMTWSTTRSSAAWGLGTLAVIVVVGALTRTAVANARHDDGSAEDRIQVLGLLLTVGAWLLGGLFNLMIYIFAVPYNFFSNVAGDVCGGSGGAGTFECLHRPGLALHVLGVVAAVSATPAAWLLLWAGSRSRICAWLSPVVIFGLYLLALRLWQPHEGLGVPDRPGPQP